MNNGHNLLPLLYTMDDDYGWSQGMRAISHALLAQELAPTTILELGCGSGQFLHELRRQQPQAQLVGSDLNPAALSHAQHRTSGAVALTQADLAHLPFADQHFALVLAFDVYDQHGVQLHEALAESLRVLCAGGLLMLRVSAHSWLEGAHDRAFNTGRRYHAQEVVDALRVAHFTIKRVTYANSLLAPVVIPVRLLQRWGAVGLTTDLYTDSRANKALATALRWEAQWLQQHNLPFGISLYILARKST